MVTTTLEQRLERARELHRAGYNCAQCVLMVYDDVHGLQTVDAARVTAAFGAGFGGQRQLCGAVSGMGAMLGLMRYTGPEVKKVTYDHAAVLAERFRAENGSIVCGELLSSRRKPCIGLIEDAVTILHKEFCDE